MNFQLDFLQKSLSRINEKLSGFIKRMAGKVPPLSGPGYLHIALLQSPSPSLTFLLSPALLHIAMFSQFLAFSHITKFPQFLAFLHIAKFPQSPALLPIKIIVSIVLSLPCFLANTFARYIPSSGKFSRGISFPTIPFSSFLPQSRNPTKRY